jgi:Tfp pilus assembly protein PilF
MFLRVPSAIILAIGIVSLAACQDNAGPDAPKSEAAVPDAAGDYAPDGADGATVVIIPEGKVLIVGVGGEPVALDGADTAVGADVPGAAYNRLLLPPGGHTVTLAEAGGGGRIDMSLTAGTGTYVMAVLEVQSGDNTARALAVLEGGRDGRIVAASAPVLAGMSRANAEAFMAASPEEKRKILAANASAAEDRTAQVKAQFASARELFEARRYNDALAAFDETLRLAPNLDSAHVFRGLTLLPLERPRDALASFDKAIALGRQNRGVANVWLSWPLYNRGLALMASGDTAAAKTALDESIGLKATPRALLARANLAFAQGEALGKKDDWDAAEPYFLAALADAVAGIDLAPRNAALWTTRSASQIMLNRNEQGCAAARTACELGDCTIVEQVPQCKAGS